MRRQTARLFFLISTCIAAAAAAANDVYFARGAAEAGDAAASRTNATGGGGTFVDCSSPDSRVLDAALALGLVADLQPPGPVDAVAVGVNGTRMAVSAALVRSALALALFNSSQAPPVRLVVVGSRQLAEGVSRWYVHVAPVDRDPAGAWLRAADAFDGGVVVEERGERRGNETPAPAPWSGDVALDLLCTETLRWLRERENVSEPVASRASALLALLAEMAPATGRFSCGRELLSAISSRRRASEVLALLAPQPPSRSAAARLLGWAWAVVVGVVGWVWAVFYGMIVCLGRVLGLKPIEDEDAPAVAAFLAAMSSALVILGCAGGLFAFVGLRKMKIRFF